MRVRPHSLRFVTSCLGTLLLVALAGCGTQGKYANQDRPPAPIVVTAAITPTGVSVSPTKFGAGPINLVVTNQTETSQRLTLAQEVNGQSAPQEQTGPINPHDTASLQANVDQGTYAVRVDGKRRSSPAGCRSASSARAPRTSCCSPSALCRQRAAVGDAAHTGSRASAQYLHACKQPR